MSETVPSLLQNGFVLSDKYTSPDISKFYTKYATSNLPIYITTDSILHLYHILFDKLLADAEEHYFFYYLQDLFAYQLVEFDKLLNSERTSEEKEAIALAIQYIQVAQGLLFGGMASSQEANEEIDLIIAHSGFSKSPLFSYKEDYSPYVARGHYTHSRTLTCYFRCMMWLGRMTFLVNGSDNRRETLVDEKTAKIQTLAAVILADSLSRYPNKKQYDTIYDFTSFFVGFSDDPTPVEYNNAVAKVIGKSGNIFSITRDETLNELRDYIKKLKPPAIYGGTGRIEIYDLDVLAGAPKPELLEEKLESTMGMRLMGQRFVPDSYITGKLVTPTIGKYLGTGNPFTEKPIRTMPTALDIMSILGSNSANTVLSNRQLNKYENYAETSANLKYELDSLTVESWNKNLYMGWLYSLKALFAKSGEGYQPFQQTEKWENRQLLSALGSWTALRHDSILHVKLSYGTFGYFGGASKKPRVLAYVEGEPEFWARLLALHRTMSQGIAEYQLFEVPDEEPLCQIPMSYRLSQFETLLSNIFEASIAQLENRPLERSLSTYLKNIATHINTIQGDIFKEYTTQIVADVHTDTNTSSVLEEGTGAMMTMIVAMSEPDGIINLAYGPVYS